MGKVVRLEARTMNVDVLDLPENFTLREVAAMIGAEWAEIVRPARLNGYVMIVDEEGKLKSNVYVNTVGSWFYESDKHGVDVIVGDVVLMKEIMGQEGPTLAGIDEVEAERLRSLLDAEKGEMTGKLLTALYDAGTAKKIMRGNGW